MNKKLRSISLLLVLSMLLGMLQITSFADDNYLLSDTDVFVAGTTADKLPELKTVLVKVNSDENGFEALTDSEIAALNVNDNIIVAIQANNFDSYVNNSYGVYSFCAAVVYNTDYLEPSATDFDYIDRVTELYEVDGSIFYNKNNDSSLKCRYSVDEDVTATELDLSSGETSVVSADTTKLKKSSSYVVVKAKSSSDTTEQLGKITEGQYIAFYEFKIKALPASASLAFAISESESLCVELGNTGLFSSTYGGVPTGLHNYMKVTSEAVLPAAPANKTGLQVKTGKSMTSPQNEGAAFSFNKADLEFVTDAPGTADLTSDDTVAYYYGDAGVTSTDGTGLTAMPNALTTAVDGKTVYAIVTTKSGQKFITSLGTLAISGKTAASIVSVNNTPSGVAKDSAVDFASVTLTIKNSLNEEETLTFSKDTSGNYVSNKYNFYIHKGTEASVGDKVNNNTDVYAEGTNNFVVSDGTLKKEFTVATDRIETIAAKDVPASAYEGQTIDFTSVKATITTTNNSTPQDITFTKDASGNFKTDNGLFIYKKDASGNLTKVTDADVYAEGDNNFVIAADGATTAAGATVKAEFTVTASNDDPVISATVSTQKYKGTATLDKSMITLSKKRPSETAPTTITLADMLTAPATYTVVLAADTTAATGADAIAIGADDVTVTDAHYGWGVFVITGGQTYQVAELKKKSSSGGGGGSSTTSYVVTYKPGSHGTLATGASKTETVDKNSYAKTTPEVVANDGYKFIGWSVDGKTVTSVSSYAITKATTFTALYEEVEEIETPEPTVEPTQAPVIDVDYTKPYASGYDDGSFAPNNNITRGELAAMIARLSYGDDLPNGVYESAFPDVDDDAWFNKYIGYLEDKDVLSGYEDGTFRPMNTITRGEISAVIARAQKLNLITYSGSFADVTDNDWAKDYIETLASANIVSGYEDGTFGPYSPLTRAEAVAIINRVLSESTPVVTFTPNDISGHWAEADILLATNERMLAGMGVMAPAVDEEDYDDVYVEEELDADDVSVAEDEVEESEVEDAE